MEKPNDLLRTRRPLDFPENPQSDFITEYNDTDESLNLTSDSEEPGSENDLEWYFANHNDDSEEQSESDTDDSFTNESDEDDEYSQHDVDSASEEHSSDKYDSDDEQYPPSSPEVILRFDANCRDQFGNHIEDYDSDWNLIVTSDSEVRESKSDSEESGSENDLEWYFANQNNDSEEQSSAHIDNTHTNDNDEDDEHDQDDIVDHDEEQLEDDNGSAYQFSLVDYWDDDSSSSSDECELPAAKQLRTDIYRRAHPQSNDFQFDIKLDGDLVEQVKQLAIVNHQLKQACRKPKPNGTNPPPDLSYFDNDTKYTFNALLKKQKALEAAITRTSNFIEHNPKKTMLSKAESRATIQRKQARKQDSQISEQIEQIEIELSLTQSRSYTPFEKVTLTRRRGIHPRKRSQTNTQGITNNIAKKKFNH